MSLSGGIMGKDMLTLAMSGVFTLIMHTRMSTQDVNSGGGGERTLLLHGQTVKTAVWGNTHFGTLWVVRFWGM